MHKKSIFINRSNFNLNSKCTKLTSVKVLTLIRCYTKTSYFLDWESGIRNKKLQILEKPESLTLEHIKSGKPTTTSGINKILLNQNIIVNNTKLEQLLKVKGIELNLPITSLTTPYNKERVNLYIELLGKSKYKGFSGVYIFIHKNTHQKYVGSSNLLTRRMDYYFKEKASLPLVVNFYLYCVRKV